MIRNSIGVVFAVAVTLALPVCGRAQDKAKGDDEVAEELVIKVYRVLDLVSPAPNYAYEGTYLPAFEAKLSRPVGYGSGTTGAVGGMGGMGGGMGGMGTGMFRVEDNLAQVAGARGANQNQPAATAVGSLPTANRRPPVTRIEMNQLIEAITTIVEPDSWDENGGNGTMTRLGGSLLIRQTAAVQSKIQSFLQAIQRESGTFRILSIDAQWLLLNQDQRTRLQGAAKDKKPSFAGQTVSREALAELPAETRRYAGQITCFNGQTVYIISGRLQTVVQGAIPVVGGSDVGYQPVLLTPHLGVLLQLTPSVLPGDDGILVDLQSSVTRADESEKPVRLRGIAHEDGDFENTQPAVQIDRLNVTAQQFATSLRIPLDKPMLVGGMTLPGSDAGPQEGVLYLVIEIHSPPEP